MKDLWALIRFLLTFAENAARTRWTIAAMVVIGALSGLAATGLLAVINTALHAEPPPLRLIVAFAGLLVLVPSLRLLASWLAIRLAQDTVLRLRVYLGRRILGTPLQQLERLGASRLMSTLTEDVSALTGAFTALPTFLAQGTIVVGCLAYLGWLSPRLLGLVGAVVLVGLISHNVLIRRAHRHFRSFRDQWDVLFERYRGIVHGAKELKLHAQRREEFLRDHLQSTAGQLRHHAMSGRIFAMTSSSWGQALFFGLIGVVLFLVPRGGGDTGVVVSGYVLTILYMLGPLTSVLATVPTMSQASVSAEKVAALGGSLGEAPEEAAPVAAPSWTELRLEAVTHTYYREREDGHFELGPISLRARRGELVFIVGGNGSGKTTLAKMLLGLYEPEQGEILLDGRRVDGVRWEEYRQLFSVVFTDFFLFDTLLGLREDGVDERARHYLTRLDLDRKVEVSDGRLSTLDLSQGQRKRLALLTAYLEDRPIYLFDEWAADQDPQFKEIFYCEILPDLRSRGKTLFVVSHDDRYYHLADRIVRLDDGRMTYDGPAGLYLSRVGGLPSEATA